MYALEGASAREVFPPDAGEILKNARRFTMPKVEQYQNLVLGSGVLLAEI